MCGGPKLRLRGSYALNIYLPDIGPPDVNFLYVAAPPPRLPSAWVVEFGRGGLGLNASRIYVIC